MAVAILLGIGPSAYAQALDGSVPMLCALSAVHDCGEWGRCDRVSAEAANVPHFVRIDVGQGTVSAVGQSRRSAPIQQVERRDGRLILQGGQESRAWSILIAGESGALSATVLDESSVIAMFGTCTVP